MLSHELRSPLNPILRWTRLLQNGKLDATRQREALATIERNAKLQAQLIEQIRSRSPEQGGTIPAIALTAYARDFDQQKAFRSGFQDRITKPVEPESLIEAIIKLVDPHFSPTNLIS